MDGTTKARFGALLAVAAILFTLSLGVPPALAAENPEITTFRRAALADGWTIAEIEAVIKVAWGDTRFSAPVTPAPVEVVPVAQVAAPAPQPTAAKASAPKAVTSTKTVAEGNPVADVIRQVASESGLDAAQANALVKLAYRESRLNPSARSSSGKYLGLFQLDKDMCDENWSDASWNTRRALRYITARYGSPTSALSHSYSHGWY